MVCLFAAAQPAQKDCTVVRPLFWSYICRCFIPAKSRGVTLMKNRPPLSRVTHKRLASSLKPCYAHEFSERPCSVRYELRSIYIRSRSYALLCRLRGSSRADLVCFKKFPGGFSHGMKNILYDCNCCKIVCAGSVPEHFLSYGRNLWYIGNTLHINDQSTPRAGKTELFLQPDAGYSSFCKQQGRLFALLDWEKLSG